MRLEELLELPEWTQDRLALAARTTQGTISRLAQRKRKASLGLVLRIEAATGGLVKAEDIPMTRRARADLKLIHAAQPLVQPASEGTAA